MSSEQKLTFGDLQRYVDLGYEELDRHLTTFNQQVFELKNTEMSLLALGAKTWDISNHLSRLNQQQNEIDNQLNYVEANFNQWDCFIMKWQNINIGGCEDNRAKMYAQMLDMFDVLKNCSESSETIQALVARREHDDEPLVAFQIMDKHQKILERLHCQIEQVKRAVELTKKQLGTCS